MIAPKIFDYLHKCNYIINSFYIPPTFHSSEPLRIRVNILCNHDSVAFLGRSTVFECWGTEKEHESRKTSVTSLFKGDGGKWDQIKFRQQLVKKNLHRIRLNYSFVVRQLGAASPCA